MDEPYTITITVIDNAFILVAIAAFGVTGLIAFMKYVRRTFL